MSHAMIVEMCCYIVSVCLYTYAHPSTAVHLYCNRYVDKADMAVFWPRCVFCFGLSACLLV